MTRMSAKETPRKEETEYVEVTVKLPRQAVEYVEALCRFSGEDPEKFWTHEVMNAVQALVDDYGRPYTEKSHVSKIYGLEKILDS